VHARDEIVAIASLAERHPVSLSSYFYSLGFSHSTTEVQVTSSELRNNSM